MRRFFAGLLPGLLLAAHCGAQSSTFDPATGEVDIACVTAVDSQRATGPLPPYQARLRRTGSSAQFTLQQIQPTDFDTDCSGVFDPATNLYTDIVSTGDNSYNVSMRRGAGNVFTLESATLRGAASTSLWVARNGTNTVYLAGAIHLLRDADYPLPRAYDEAYAKATALYFEVDMDNPDENGQNLTSAQFQRIMRDPQGKTLAQVLSGTTHQLLRDYLANTWNVPIENVSHWSAQMLVITFSRWHLEFQYGVAADGVDAHFARRAIADRKPIGGLETTASQQLVLQTMDEGLEEEAVRSFLETVATGEDIKGFDALVRIWRRGDTAEITRSEILPMREYDYQDYLLLQVNRNNAWLPQIEALLQSPATEMVVVGVAHMAGPDGLITQLRKRGYRVDRY